MDAGTAVGLTAGKLPLNCLLISSLNRGSAGADTAGLLHAGASASGSRIGANVILCRCNEGMVWMAEAGEAGTPGLTQEGKGKRVARTRGKPVKLSVGEVAAVVKPLVVAPVSRERNSTPILACRRTLCTNGFIRLNRDNDNLTTSYL